MCSSHSTTRFSQTGNGTVCEATREKKREGIHSATAEEVLVMKRFMPAFGLSTTMLAFLLGYAIGPVRSVAIQSAAGSPPGTSQPQPAAGALPPGDYSRC